MTREYWKELIEKWQVSGQSMAEFCRDERLSYWTFREWKRRIMSPGKMSENKTGLIKINLQNKQKKSQTIEVVVGSSMILVPQDFDESHFIRIVKSLRSIT